MREFISSITFFGLPQSFSIIQGHSQVPKHLQLREKKYFVTKLSVRHILVQMRSLSCNTLDTRQDFQVLSCQTAKRESVQTNRLV